MQSLVVPKNRKPKFDLSLKIIDLINVPYLSGKVFVKWRLPNSTESGDRTSKVNLKDHRAQFDYEKIQSLRFVVDKNGTLQEEFLLLEVYHDINSGGKEDRSSLGVVKINLSEYVDATRHTQEHIQRRFLLQESKINSTLKVGIHLTQIEGDRQFLAPPLKSAPVFIGLAGVVAGEAGDSAGPNQLNTVSSSNREAGDDLRELYRKTLAAELTCQPGELGADQIIEDIFAGGDGWGDLRETPQTDPASNRGRGILQQDTWNDSDIRSLSANKRPWSDFQHSRRFAVSRNSGETLSKSDDPFRNGNRSRTSFSQVSHRSDLEKDWVDAVPEVDELEEREDLRCWNYKATE